jgi:hypothetical protein
MISPQRRTDFIQSIDPRVPNMTLMGIALDGELYSVLAHLLASPLGQLQISERCFVLYGISIRFGFLNVIAPETKVMCCWIEQ